MSKFHTTNLYLKRLEKRVYISTYRYQKEGYVIISLSVLLEILTKKLKSLNVQVKHKINSLPK